ncbi:glycosyltransferase family 4 protein [Polynucleobacter sp. MWH-Creno-3A4]|nr:glycosyltransferase family 4 protein [Polynucleobacter sp. MWH-Creno-3A4]
MLENKTDLKVLLLTQYFWPESFQINAVAKSLHKNGVTVTIMTGKPNYPKGRFFDGYGFWGCARERYDGMEVFRVPITPRRNKNTFLFLNYLSFVISGSFFGYFLLRNKKFDAIFVYAPSPIFQAIPAIIFGKLWKIPVVLWVQDLWPESLQATGTIKNKSILKLVGTAVATLYKNCTLILVQSTAFIEPVKLLAKNRKVLYHPNSVDEIFLTRTHNSIKPLSFAAAPFVIIFAGNVGHAQAVEVIVEAADLLREIKNIRFDIYGSGSRLEWLKGEVVQRGLCNINCLGHFPVEAMPDILGGANALLVTLGAEEIFKYTIPNKIQAYLAVGRPIVASLDGEGARIVELANAGLTAPAGDSISLSQAILRLYNSTPEELLIMGENGKAYFDKEFNMDRLTDKLIHHLSAAMLEHNS